MFQEHNSRGMLMTFTALLVLFLLVGGGFSLFVLPALSAPPAAEDSEQGELSQPQAQNDVTPVAPELTRHPALGSNIVDVVEEVGPAVVRITALRERVVYDFFLRQFRQEIPAEGSGVIFDTNGYILTNNHVVQDARRIMVSLPDREEQEFEATIVGRDSVTDLAVIKIEGDDLPVANLGNSDQLRVGEVAIAIGNPYGLSNTVTVGVISALGRRIAIEEGTELTDIIQTDAAINQGNSGGPLINGMGEVIGINTAIVRGAQGIGFAIPINTARDIARDLMEHGRVIRPWLGIHGGTITPVIAAEYGLVVEKGVYVSQVMANSPAYYGDLKAEDIIVAMDGVSIDSIDDLQRLLRKKDPHQQVKLVIYRGDTKMELDIQLEPQPQR